MIRLPRIGFSQRYQVHALKPLSVALVALTALVCSARAQPVPVTDPAFVRAALVVKTFDRLNVACRKAGGFSQAQAGKVDVWQDEHGVHRIRSRMRQLADHLALERQVDQGADAIVRRMSSGKVDACAAALSIAQLPDAQFRKVAPQLVAADPAQADADQSSSPASTRPSASSPAGTAGAAATESDVLGQIDSFGFDTRPKVGAGGFVTLDIYPVVLLKSGEALTQVKGLAAPGGLDAYRLAHPDHITRWRRQGGKLQLVRKTGWEPLPFQTTYARLPDGMKLDGLYRDLEGAGTLGSGGTDSVTAYDEYRFSRDGTVERTGGVGGRVEAGDASVATSARKRVRQGRYRIEGLTLSIRYDDGTSEQRILIADPKNPDRAIWLDGVGYVKRGG